MQKAPNASKHSFLPYLFSCERKDRAVGDNRQLQICDNLSVSLTAASSPERGAFGAALAMELLQKIVTAFARSGVP